MKKRMTSLWKRGWLLVLLLGLLLIGLFLSQAFACQFWGVVGSPTVGGLNQTVYDAAVQRLPDLADNNSSNNGWSVTYNRPGFPVNVRRSISSVYTPDCTAVYVARCNQARDLGAWGVVGHARNDGGSVYTGIINPHPFVYPDMFGHRTYSFVHNGTINNNCLGMVEDSLGPAWAATRLFYNGHEGWRYTYWGDPGHRRLDSEYYGMLLAKYLLVGENYYWPANTPATVNSVEEYAITRVLDKITRSLGNLRFNSLNALLSADNELWMLFRRTAADDHPNDNYRHYLSYYTGAPNTLREASTTQIPGADWVRMNALNESRCVHLQPTIAITNDLLPEITDDPTELRVNQATFSERSQTDPAIAANPVDGTFLTVWASSADANIWCRAYSQMGTSEYAQLQVNSSSVPGTARGLPAVAFSDLGDRGMIVWKERPAFSPSRDYTLIVGRRFFWDERGFRFTWDGPERVLSTTGLPVDHPTVDCIRKGFMVAWHTEPSLTLGRQIRYSIEFDGFSGMDICLIASPVDHYTKPDLCAIDRERYIVVYEKDVPLLGTDLLQVQQIGIEPGWSGIPMELPETALGSVGKAWPSIARLTNGRFAVGYNSDHGPFHVAAEIYDAPAGGWVSWVESVLGENPNASNPVDIAVLNPETFYIAYSVYNVLTHEHEVWAARRDHNAFVDPVRLNETLAGDQKAPVIAVAHGFGPAVNQQLYDAHSANHYFNDHRLAIWQSNNQDGSEWGIVGKFQGVAADLTLMAWNTPEVFINAGHLPCTDLLLAEGLEEGGSGLDESAAAEPIRESVIPATTALHPAYPNPFNPSTMLRFDLETAATVRIDVFDIGGRRVATLVNELHEAGSYALRFDGTALTSGTYFVRMQAGAVSQMQKLLLVK